MEHLDISAAEAAAALPAFTLPAKALAQAAAILASLAPNGKSYRRPDILQCVLIEAGADAVRLTTTDCETWASIELAADVAMPGRCAVPAAGLSDAARKMPKGTQATFTIKDERAQLTGGRAVFGLATFAGDDFPLLPLANLEPAETWEAAPDPAALVDGRSEGLIAPDALPKLVAKAIKRATPPKKSGLSAPAAQLARFEPAEALGEGGYSCRAPRLRITLGDVILVAPLREPAFGWKRPKRNPFSHGWDGERMDKARAYAEHLRSVYDLPASIGGATGRLEVVDGYAVGMTFGEAYWDSTEYREVPDFQPPAGVEVEVSGCMSECEVDGVLYCRMGEKPWQMQYVGTNQLCYPDGSFCLVFPRAARPVISEIVVSADGVEYPVATNGSGNIDLSAERIAELVGDLADVERVEIAPFAMYQGERVPAGFFLPTPPKMSDRAAASMTAAEMAAYVEACRPYAIAPEAVADEPEPAPAAAPAGADLVARDLSPEKPRGSTAGDEDLRAMVAQLAARVATLESDSKGVASEPASVRQLPRALRLRIVGAYGRLRAERDAERAFTATLAGEAGDYRALIEAKLAAAEAEVLREREMRLNQVRGYSDTLAAAQAESTRRNSAMLDAERRAEAAEGEAETLRRRVAVAEGAQAVAEGRQSTLETENAGLRRQIAENQEGAGWERIRAAAALADQSEAERDAAPIILITPATRQPARA